jgi:hypothetical protein
MSGSNRTGIILQNRDRHLLEELASMRVADREQVKCVAGFSSTRKTNERLFSLTRTGFLRRFFQGSAAGGKRALYALSPKGAEFVGTPYRGPRRGRDEFLVADTFVAHQLEINRIYCLLKYQPIPTEDAKFVKWSSFFESIASDIRLIPDGYVEILAREQTVAAFLEVDLGNESRSVWVAKVRTYLQYAVSGVFQTKFGQPQFRVLVAADSTRRMNSLRAATAAITEKIFWFTTLDLIRERGMWTSIWERPKGNSPQPLL